MQTSCYNYKTSAWLYADIQEALLLLVALQCIFALTFSGESSIQYNSENDSLLVDDPTLLSRMVLLK